MSDMGLAPVAMDLRDHHIPKNGEAVSLCWATIRKEYVADSDGCLSVPSVPIQGDGDAKARSGVKRELDNVYGIDGHVCFCGELGY